MTEEAFHRFLALLDAKAESAGQKYEALRLKLVKYFDWRGAHFPDECADETLDRVVRKVEAGETIRDIPTYCYGIARLVFLETLKAPDSRRRSLDEVQEVAAPLSSADDDREEHDCFEKCLNALPSENRQLLLEYYQDEGRGKINNRQAKAEQLGIPLNALRSRVQRLRDKLEQCVALCLGRPGAAKEKKDSRRAT